MFEETLARLAVALDARSIPYMVVGGQAVLLHGEPRLTRDIDVTVGLDLGGLDTLLEVVRDLSLKPIPEDVRSFVRETMVLPALDEASGVRVDFILSFTPYERQAMDRVARRVIRGCEVRFASAEDLIVHKIFAGRARDLEDVRSILARNPDLDHAYIRRWLREFDASTGPVGAGTFLRTFEEVSAERG